MTVLLENGTVGQVDQAAKVGEVVTVTLADENGRPLEKRGRIIEILEE